MVLSPLWYRGSPVVSSTTPGLPNTVSHGKITTYTGKAEVTHIVPAVLPFTCWSFWAHFFPQ